MAKCNQLTSVPFKGLTIVSVVYVFYYGPDIVYGSSDSTVKWLSEIWVPFGIIKLLPVFWTHKTIESYPVSLYIV